MNKFRPSRMLFAVALALDMVRLTPLTKTARASGFPDAHPQVFQPFAGDPRLEPIPDHPINLANVETFTTDQFGVTKTLTMRFPPRVNGQVESNGDKHADLYVLFDASTHLRLNHPLILEAIPNGATGPGATVSDLLARNFSPIWEVQAVMVDTSVSSGLITSASQLFTSLAVMEIIQTNIFLNCPIVPNGSTVDPGSSQPEDAFALLTDGNGQFDKNKFPFDVPTKTFTKMRNFFVTEVNPGAGALVPHPVLPPVILSGLAANFPPIEPEGKGNVIPVILTDP